MSSHNTSSQPKRPSMPSRHSSTSIYNSRSSSSNLSSSAQRQKAQRHVVYPRIGPTKATSHVKNPGSKTKITFAQPSEADPSSPRLTHAKRNSSNLQLIRNNSSQDLKRNHSETSLKKNRSSGQLTKLTKSDSSKNLTKASKSDAKSRRNQLKNSELLANPTVRFDLGDDDDGWTEDSGTQSPNTSRSNTERNSLVVDLDLSRRAEAAREESSPPQSPHATEPTTPPPDQKSSRERESTGKDSKESGSQRSRQPDAGILTSRLLKRNVSFNASAEVSNVSASARGAFNTKAPSSSGPPSEDASQASSIRHEARADGQTEDGAENDELVSRFLSGTGSSNMTGEGSFQSRVGSHNAHTSPEATEVRRNRSLPNVVRQLSRSSSQHSGVFTPGNNTPKSTQASRTQEKLWLERASANIEPQHVHPVNLYRGARFPGAIPFHSSASESRANPQMRQMLDQTDIEYRRVRLFQNPLADAINRLQDAGVAPKTKLVARPKGKSGGAGNNGGDGKFGLSQSLRSQRMGKENVGEGKKPKVSFQGIKERKDDGMYGRTPNDEGGVEPREDPREICRRLWDTQTMSEAE